MLQIRNRIALSGLIKTLFINYQDFKLGGDEIQERGNECRHQNKNRG